jgi:hypothetical protein
MFHPDRFLYNQAYLDANCDASAVPLNEDNGVDSSVATFATNYVLAAVTIFTAFVLSTKEDKERVGLFVCIYLFSTGLAFGIAGVGHQLSEEKEELLNRILIPLVAVFGNVGTYALLRVIIIFHTRFEGWIRVAWWIISPAMIVYASVVALDNQIPTGIPGVLTLLIALVVHVRLAWRKRESSVLLKVFGFFTMIVGGGVQMSLASVCGFDGYPDCFRDCPLPAPEFNHNALFHVLALVYFLLFGLGEWMQPAQEYIAVLRRDREDDTNGSNIDLDVMEKMS